MLENIVEVTFVRVRNMIAICAAGTLSLTGIAQAIEMASVAKLDEVRNNVRAVACSEGVPPGLALAVIETESRFDNSMRGSRGEIGAAQILPATAAAFGFDLRRLANEFEYNTRAGVQIIRSLLKSCEGNLRTALYTYRAGPKWRRLTPRALLRVQAYANAIQQLVDIKYAGVQCRQ
jgi:soluble lytic murein transglycosylase-like protein